MFLCVLYLIRDLRVVPPYLYSGCKLDLDSNITRVSKCNVNFEAVEGILKTELRGRCEQHKVVKRKALEKLLTLG